MAKRKLPAAFKAHEFKKGAKPKGRAKKEPDADDRKGYRGKGDGDGDAPKGKKGATAARPSGGLTANARRKTATIAPSKGHASGRFPMPDKKHARLALQDLPKADGLSGAPKAKIKARADKMLGKGGKKAAKKRR